MDPRRAPAAKEDDERARESRPTVVVVTGLSGAGKSQALHALEDLGFFCVDNLPTALAPEAVALCERGGMTRLALGIDVRVRAFLGEVANVLRLLDGGGQRDVECSSSTRATRRSCAASTRRGARTPSRGREQRPRSAVAVLDGVPAERERLAPRCAPARTPSSTRRTLCVHELRRILIAHFGPASGGAPRMITRIVSFGFKYGTPVDADLVLDVRFLDNPYFVPELGAAGPGRARGGVRPRDARDASSSTTRARCSRSSCPGTSARARATSPSPSAARADGTGRSRSQRRLPAIFRPRRARPSGCSTATPSGATRLRPASGSSGHPRRTLARRARAWSSEGRHDAAPVLGGGRRSSRGHGRLAEVGREPGGRALHHRQPPGPPRPRRDQTRPARLQVPLRRRGLPGRPDGERQERDGRPSPLRLEGHGHRRPCARADRAQECVDAIGALIADSFGEGQ